jgi:hypothetical protein
MSKRGPLSKIEKFYIENNFESMSVDDMAKDLDRAKSVVKAFANRCTPKVQEKETPLSQQIFSNKRGSTIMTENGSVLADELRPKFASKSRVRPDSTTRIKK